MFPFATLGVVPDLSSLSSLVSFPDNEPTTQCAPMHNYNLSLMCSDDLVPVFVHVQVHNAGRLIYMMLVVFIHRLYRQSCLHLLARCSPVLANAPPSVSPVALPAMPPVAQPAVARIQTRSHDRILQPKQFTDGTMRHDLMRLSRCSHLILGRSL